MRRFSDFSDAVIFTREEADISRRIAEELSAMTERDSDIFDIQTMSAMFQ